MACPTYSTPVGKPAVDKQTSITVGLGGLCSFQDYQPPEKRVLIVTPR